MLFRSLGPVVRVVAQAAIGTATRTVSSEPLKGSIINVEVPTTVNGVLSFANGASVTITTSWDVWKHRRVPFEIYGSEGSMLVPDPNFFGGEPMVTEHDRDWMPLDISVHPFWRAEPIHEGWRTRRRLPHCGPARHGRCRPRQPPTSRQRRTSYARAGGAGRVRAIFH